MSAFIKIQKLYGKFLYFCGVISGVSTFLMMALVVLNAVGRFIINKPIPGTLEITEALLTVLILLSLALTQYEGGHIHVVLITKRLSPRWQKALALVGVVLGLVFFAWSAYAAWGFAMQSLAMNEQEWGSVRFPLYPVKFIVFGGLMLISIQFLFDAIAILLGVGLHEGAEVEGELTI